MSERGKKSNSNQKDQDKTKSKKDLNKKDIFNLDDIKSALGEDEKVAGISKVPNLNNHESLSSDESEIEALDHDGSVPLRYINRIHDQLAYNEAIFKRKIYQKYIEHLEKEKARHPHIQNKINTYIRTLKQEINGANKTDYHFDNDLKGIQLVQFPNFATARISYIPVNKKKVHSKVLRFSTPIDGNDEHTEEQILRYVKDKKLIKEKYKTAKLIRIDSHSKFSACNRKCQNKLKSFREDECKEGYKIKIEQTCDILYKKRDYKLLNDKHVKESIRPTTAKTGKIFLHGDNFLVSDGANSNRLIKSIIDKVRHELVSDALKNSSEAIEKEIQDLTTILEGQFRVENVDIDGNCFFRAIANDFNRITGQQLSHESIRREVVNYIKDNHHLRFPNLLNIENYIARMSSNGEWAGEPELQAIADILRVDIHIIRNGRNPVVFHGLSSDNGIIYVGYIADVHFVRLIDETEELFRQFAGIDISTDSYEEKSSDALQPSQELADNSVQEMGLLTHIDNTSSDF